MFCEIGINNATTTTKTTTTTEDEEATASRAAAKLLQQQQSMLISLLLFFYSLIRYSTYIYYTVANDLMGWEKRRANERTLVNQISKS